MLRPTIRLESPSTVTKGGTSFVMCAWPPTIGVGTDAAVLMDGRAARHIGPIPDFHVPGQHHVVCQDDVVP